MKNIMLWVFVGFLVWSAATGRLTSWIQLAREKVGA
jgi:hypothetical protein